jgi:ornithine carbamoyltransferase
MTMSETFKLFALEFTDDVFEPPAPVVGDRAENRRHAIEAIMVATLGQPGGVP